MATVKTKFRASSVEKREGTLYFQVIHRRLSRQINTRLRLFPHEWDERRGVIIDPKTEDDDRADYLAALRETVQTERARIESIISQTERTGKAYSAEDIVERYWRTEKEGGFLSFVKSHILHLGKAGRVPAVEKMRTTLMSFVRFYGGDEVPFDRVDSELMEEYEGWLKAQGVCINTVSFYMRQLRAVYNLAVERGLTAQQYPFRRVYTGVDKTVKRAVPLSVVRRLRDLDLTLSPQKAFARDLFLFSFYTRGMSFVDMAYLRKSDLRNGILTYRRHKTNQRLSIKWEKPMQDLVDRYPTGNSPFLLPVIKNPDNDCRRQYRNALRLVNRLLKEVGQDLGLAIPLTTYVARHGWASIAQSKHIPTETISKALGHDSEKTTRIYLASLDTSAVDRANSVILRSL